MEILTEGQPEPLLTLKKYDPRVTAIIFFNQCLFKQLFFFIFACQEGFVLRCTEIKAEQNIGSFKSQLQEKQSYNSLLFFFFCLFIFFFFVCSKRDGKESLGTKFLNQAGQVQYVYSYIFNFPLHHQYFNSSGRPFHKVVTLK